MNWNYLTRKTMNWNCFCGPGQFTSFFSGSGQVISVHVLLVRSIHFSSFLAGHKAGTDWHAEKWTEIYWADLQKMNWNYTTRNKMNLTQLGWPSTNELKLPGPQQIELKLLLRARSTQFMCCGSGQVISVHLLLVRAIHFSSFLAGHKTGTEWPAKNWTEIIWADLQKMNWNWLTHKKMNWN